MNKLSNAFRIKRMLDKASLYCQQAKIHEAKEIYMDLIKIVPSHPTVLTNLGTIELQIGNTEVGIDFLKKSLEIDINQSIAISNLGNAFVDLKDFDQAIFYYDLAVKINPKFTEAYYNRGRAYRKLHKYEEAISSYENALSLSANHINALIDLGFLFNEIKRFDKAIEMYNAAIKINPNNIQAHYNKSVTLGNLKCFDEAIKECDQTIKSDPNYLRAYNLKSSFLINLKQFKEALNLIDQIILRNFDNAEALCNKSLINFYQNNFQDAWMFYESRWNVEREKPYLISSNPLLHNFDVKNKNIYLWPEQGVGDQILFCTMLYDAIKTQNQFIVSLDSRLIPIFSRSFSAFSNIKFTPYSKIIDEALYDYHLPQGGLGKFFRSSIHNFENRNNFSYLKADANKSLEFSKSIQFKNYKICGISWKSQNKEIGRLKSIDLKDLMPIFKIPNIIFINLQYGDVTSDLKEVKDEFGVDIKVIDSINIFNDLDSLASLIDVCDFVCSTSNATVHLAGALGKETYLFTPFSEAKIWYWSHENYTHSLWYPSVSIFSQPKIGDWETPIKSVANLLTSKLELHK
jgi:tetratricopeptide (TPR) repeat protein